MRTGAARARPACPPRLADRHRPCRRAERPLPNSDRSHPAGSPLWQTARSSAVAEAVGGGKVALRLATGIAAVANPVLRFGGRAAEADDWPIGNVPDCKITQSMPHETGSDARQPHSPCGRAEPIQSLASELAYSGSESGTCNSRRSCDEQRLSFRTANDSSIHRANQTRIAHDDTGRQHRCPPAGADGARGGRWQGPGPSDCARAKNTAFAVFVSFHGVRELRRRAFLDRRFQCRYSPN